MKMKMLDVAGVGVGPFNLSLAALLHPLPDLRWRFFERRPSFEWQAGMMLPGTRMQTSYLKDLVTPVDPTSPFSFLAYLVSTGRFYRFINAEFPRVRRVEFADYMRWASERIPSLTFGAQVHEVSFNGENFKIELEGREPVRARDLVLGSGLSQHVPSWARRHMSGVCLHSGDYLRKELSLAGQRVVIIGGGQSGAEIFLNIAAARDQQPSQLTWVSRRPNLEPLDETTFVNEYFTPDYVRQYHRLPDAVRAMLVESQKLAGDGVSPDTLRELSQMLYEGDFLSPERRAYRILPNREAHGMTRTDGAFRLELRNRFDHGHETIGADVVILCTGYSYDLPAYLKPINDMLTRDSKGHIKLKEDYVASWSGPDSNRIYMQNVGRYSHGIADPQLSLAAWRASVIVNSVMRREVYRTDFERPPVQWQSSSNGNRDHARAYGLDERDLT
jgi:lysine N6-hydroxylase